MDKVKYPWLIVMKNGKEYLIKNEILDAEELIKHLIPTQINEDKWTIMELAEDTPNGFNTVAIKGADISSILFNGVWSKIEKNEQ